MTTSIITSSRLARTTHELLVRLRKQVPGKAAARTEKGERPSLGEDIFRDARYPHAERL